MTAPVSTLPRRRLPPGARLPLGRGRLRTGTAVSIALHALVLLVVLWQTTDLLGGGGHGKGPRGGGGGGGGRPAVTWFTLPPPSGPTLAVDLPAQPAALVSVLPLPDPVPLNLQQLPPPVVSPTTVGQGPGQSGGTGNGPGTGGGTGTGTGPGTGSDVGPGTGGEGGYIFPADPRATVLPPPCAHGLFTVRFWVGADGKVSRVEVDPLPRDAGCRREMLDKMLGYRFRPARTRDGQPVASVFVINVAQK